MIQGPNVKKLIVPKMSKDAIPSGGGFPDAINFFLDQEKFKAAVTNATEWVEMAIRLIRGADEPNPWKNCTDEEIAGHLIASVGEKRSQQ